MLSHRNYVANIAQLVPYQLMENSATTVQVMPMFHCVLYCNVLYCIALYCTVLYCTELCRSCPCSTRRA